jgi:hypothetical protein
LGRLAEAVRTMVAETIAPRRMPGVRTRLGDGVKRFIFNFLSRWLPHHLIVYCVQLCKKRAACQYQHAGISQDD